MPETVTERWRPLPGWEDLYLISDRGNVHSTDRETTYPDGSVRKFRGRLRTPARNPKDGRRTLALYRNSKSQVYAISRLVLTAFDRPPKPGEEACHEDGDTSRDHLDNLRWDDHSGNMRDQIKHGTNANLNKETCPRGHLLQKPNLVRNAEALGSRSCLACNRAHARVNYAKRQGAVLDFQEVADRCYADIMRPAA